MKAYISRFYILTTLILYIHTLCLYHFQIQTQNKPKVIEVSQDSKNNFYIISTVDLIFKTAKTEVGFQYSDIFVTRFKKVTDDILFELICKEHVIKNEIISFISHSFISDTGPDIPEIIFPFHFFL